MTKLEFTIEEGFEVQTQQLAQWKAILIPEVYAALEEYATRNISEVKDGFDIRRGVDLDNYIGNYMLGHRM